MLATSSRITFDLTLMVTLGIREERQASVVVVVPVARVVRKCDGCLRIYPFCFPGGVYALCVRM